MLLTVLNRAYNSLDLNAWFPRYDFRILMTITGECS